jgi:transposase
LIIENQADYKKRIRDIEKEEERLAQRKKSLLDEEKRLKEERTKLEQLYKQSGYKTPKALVEALASHYNVRVGGRTKSGAPRRKRTKITPQLRDAVKKAVKGGMSMNQAAKEFQISYAVVSKMVKGGYDKI